MNFGELKSDIRSYTEVDSKLLLKMLKLEYLEKQIQMTLVSMIQLL
jgi:hypothetical protein